MKKTIIQNFLKIFRPTKDFIYELSCETGKFFGGRIVSLSNNVYFRIQPKLDQEIDKIKLGSNFPTTNILLASSKFDFTFSKTLYWTTIFQYGSQSENFGINSRLQWRFFQIYISFIMIIIWFKMN